jgi:arginase
MQAPHRRFDLALSYPQWHGSGRSAHLPRGAEAVAAICSRYAPLRSVPLAGEGEAAGGINRWTAILEQFHSAQAILDAVKPRRVLTAGGDCAVDVAVIDYLHRLYPDLTVIWVDAHLDANTEQTTPSGNFHGMPVAALIGSVPAALQGLLGPPLAASHFFYAAAHVGDDGEWQFQRDRGLDWWEPDRPLAGPVHVHFDLDALDPAEFPYVAYPEGRLSMAAGLDIVRTAAAGGELVGLTITEFAPADQAAADAGSGFIERLCEAACR